MTVTDKHHPQSHTLFNFQHLLWQRRVAWILMAVIGYGSLFPLDWDFANPNHFGWFEFSGPLDIFKNVAVCVPLGVVVAFMRVHQRNPRKHFWLWAGGMLAFAVFLQVAQVFLPRYPEAADVATNMTGFVLGYWWGNLFTARWLGVLRRRMDGTRLAPFMVLLAVMWLLVEAFPFIPVWNGRMLEANLASLTQADWFKPKQFLIHLGSTWLGAWALFQAVRAMRNWYERAYVVVGFIFLLMLMANVIVIAQSPSIAGLAGMLCGLFMWIACTHLFKPRTQTVLLGVVGLLLYLVHTLVPLNWRDPVFFNWWPYSSMNQGNLSVVTRSYCLDALSLGVMMWAMLRLGLGLPWVVGCAASLGFAAEWVQRYLMYRWPESSIIFTVLLLAFLIRLCERGVAPQPGAAFNPSVQTGTTSMGRV
ncbi:MAG: VanZ family protein [Burkholderiaceae bacterium]